MRVCKSDTDYAIVEVEPPNTEMKSDFNGCVNLGFYILFEFDADINATSAYIWFSDGHKGGHLTDWTHRLTEDECLRWCDRQYGGG